MTKIQKQGLRRGDAIHGGLFVGVSIGGTAWVCYGPQAEFDAMCETFDRGFAPRS